MRKFLIAATAAAALSLGACAQGPGQPTSLADFVAGVRDAANQACGFVPDVEVVTNIFLSGVPLYSTLSGIVDAVCSAVKPKSVLPRFHPPTVAGVRVTGHWTR